jgi:hypothetical protein
MLSLDTLVFVLLWPCRLDLIFLFSQKQAIRSLFWIDRTPSELTSHHWLIINMCSPLAHFMMSLPQEVAIVSDNARISCVVARNIDQEPVRPSRWVAEKDSTKVSSGRAEKDSTKILSGRSSVGPLAPKLPCRRGSIDPLAPKLPYRRRSIDYLPELQFWSKLCNLARRTKRKCANDGSS